MSDPELAAKCPGSLNMHTIFRLRGGWCKVVRADDSTAYHQTLNKVKLVVILGSLQHQQALIERMVEIDMEVDRLENAANQSDTLKAEEKPVSADDPNCAWDGMLQTSKQRRIDLLRAEGKTRTEELMFIRENCKIDDDAHDEEDDLEIPGLLGGTRHAPEIGSSEAVECFLVVMDHREGITKKAAEQSSSESTAISDSTTDLGIPIGEVIRVTHETFGEVGMMREYSIKSKEKLFRKPKIRQYFNGPVLHRSTQEMRSTWYEMFVDLLYVGIFTKAGLFISSEQSWESFTKFVFVMVPLISHWQNFTWYNNGVSHEDLYMKFHFLFICISAMVMGNTLVNTFDPNPESNTSAIFLLSYICARVYIHFAQFIVCFVFDRRFSKSMTPVLIFRAISIVPHAIILAFPTNGTSERDNTRWGLWWFGTVTELIHPFISLPIMRALPNANYRVAINIEHLAERTGILYTYALGVVAVTFLYDTKSQHIQLVMGVMILALIIGNNLNHLYFRHESGNHFKHAMRRAWYTGLGWTFIHYPLVIATLSLGAVMSVMITVRFNQAENIVDSPVALKNEWKNIYFVSLGTIYFCFMSLGLLHQNQPPTPKKTKEEKQALTDESETKVKTKKLKIRTRMPNLSQEKRCIVILALTMVIVVVGVAVPERSWSVEGMFGFGAGITSFSVFMMEWAILKKAKGPKQVVEL